MVSPLGITATQRDAFFVALRAGSDRQDAAAHAGVEFEVVARRIERDVEFGLAVATAESDARLSRVAAIARSAQGDWRAAAWLQDNRERLRDPAKLCTGRSKTTKIPCGNWKGQRTEHPGFGTCWLHLGNSITGRTHAKSEARLKQARELFLSLSLSQVADGLARDAASRALATDSSRSEDFARNVNAFARAAERAEGSKITIEGRLEFMQSLSDEEVAAALAEIKDLLATARGKQMPA